MVYWKSQLVESWILWDAEIQWSKTVGISVELRKEFKSGFPDYSSIVTWARGMQRQMLWLQ